MTKIIKKKSKEINTIKDSNPNKPQIELPNSLKKIFNDTLNKIVPDDKILIEVNKIVELINLRLKKSKIIAECVAGGSIAKDTYLKNDYDIDLFMRFSSSYDDSELSNKCEKILKELCKDMKCSLDRIHGSRDYFQFQLKRNNQILHFEIIPVVHIHPGGYHEAKNITDLSPEHVTWVKKYTNKNPELKNEIRLAKQFCKSIKVYGAESYINGFSGHIVDILVIHYGSFYKLIKAFSKYDISDLNKPIIIDPEKNLSNPLKQLNKSKITPLIIVDPVQENRNSAAALSREKLLMFIDASKRFLSKPNITFFEIKPFEIDKEIKYRLIEEFGNISIKEIDKRVEIVRVTIELLDGSKDVIGTKALKVYESIVEQLQLNDFKILASDWNFYFDKKNAVMYFLSDKNISKELLQEGPPTSHTKDYERFINKHSTLKHETFFKDGRVYALVPRKFPNAKSFIDNLTKKDYVCKRFKKIIIR